MGTTTGDLNSPHLDGERLNQLLTRYKDQILERAERTARRLNQNPDGHTTSDDIAQDVLLHLTEILRQNKRWPLKSKDGGAMKALIATLVLRRWVDEIRKRNAIPRQRVKDEQGLHLPDGVSVFDTVPAPGGGPDESLGDVVTLIGDVKRLRAMVVQVDPQRIGLFEDLLAGRSDAEIRKKNGWLQVQLVAEISHLMGMLRSAETTAVDAILSGEEA